MNKHISEDLRQQLIRDDCKTFSVKNGDEWKEFVNVVRCKDCIERSGCIIRSIQDFGDDFYCKWGSKQEI